jgi:peptide deformylase
MSYVVLKLIKTDRHEKTLNFLLTEMALLPIEKGPKNKILRTVSSPLKKVEKKLGKFLDDMKDTMFAAEGIGLAAPQVSQNIRVVICRFNHGTDHEIIVDMVNPVIVSHSEDKDVHEEGCLSLPGEFDNVPRWKSLTVKYLDRKGREHMLKLQGLNARIVQHEVDHIDGHLYIDRVGKERMSTLDVERLSEIWYNFYIILTKNKYGNRKTCSN